MTKTRFKIPGSARSIRSSSGFTLLEVLVAMAILALTLTTLGGSSAMSFQKSNYARHITVATLLARSKMLDIELELEKDGFVSTEQSSHGDFSEEGHKSMRWKALVRPVEFDVSQMLKGMLGADEVSSDQLPDAVGGFLEQFKGTGGGAETVSGQEANELMGGDMLQTIFQQVGDMLKESIREIRLEIEWGEEGRDLDAIVFVQYVTTDGRLSVPQFQNPGVRPGGGGVPPGSTPPNGQNTPPRPPPAQNQGILNLGRGGQP